MQAAVVVMFPGLGAQYGRMVERFVAAHPDQAAAIAAAQARVAAIPGVAALPAGARAELDLQVDIHALNLAWWRVAGEALDPAACCGHSLGWYAALVASGVIDEAASLDLIAHVFLAGHAAFAQDEGEVAIVTLREPADFARVAAVTGVEILCANNAVQHVLHGSPEQLAAVERELGAALLGLMKLPTHIPFHSRRLDVLRPQLDGLAERLGIRPAPMRRQLWSHIDARPVANGAAALALVETQPWQQVRWLDMVERLIQAGGYELVEVGPNRVLTQLTRWICPQLDIEFTDHLRRKERA